MIAVEMVEDYQSLSVLHHITTSVTVKMTQRFPEICWGQTTTEFGLSKKKIQN